MNYVRIAILDTGDALLGFLDNLAPNAAHYADDKLTEYLQGAAYTLELKTLTAAKESRFLVEGNKLAFLYNDRAYYTNIVRVEKDSLYTRVTAEGLTFELLNEYCEKYKAAVPMTLEEYFNTFVFERSYIGIGFNEVANESLKLDFESEETVLKRLFRLFEAFGVELEFQTNLGENYALERITVNAKTKIGSDRSSEILRYKDGAQGISKTSDISELYTAIRPLGQTTKTKITHQTTITKDASGNVVKTVEKVTTKSEEITETKTVTTTGPRVETVIQIVKKEGDTSTTRTERYDNGLTAGKVPSDCTEQTTTKEEEEQETTVSLVGFIATLEDENGTYISAGDGTIRAPQARDRFPSVLARQADGTYSDGYIMRFVTTDAQDSAALFNQTVSELQAACVPKVEYKIDGYIQGRVGDYFTIADEQYNPPTYLKARIIKQETSFTDPSKNQTSFDNFTELKSEVSEDILEQMKRIAETIQIYDISVESNNGTVFKSESDSTTLTAHIRDSGVELSDEFTFRWYKDGEFVTQGQSITVEAADVELRAVYRVDALLDDKVRGSFEVTIIQVKDGEKGEDGKDGKDGITQYLHIAYADSADGLEGFSLTDSEKPYLGQCISLEETAPTDPSAYLWSLIKGKDGKDGKDGENGTNGSTRYLHIAYADSADGLTGFSLTDSSKNYLGQCTSFDSSAPTTPATYSWSLIRGADGTNGTNGKTITGLTPQFYRSTSSTSQTGGSWTTTMPEYQDNTYLWIRNRVTYDDGTNTVYTSAYLDKTWSEARLYAKNLVLATGKDLEDLITTNYRDVTKKVTDLGTSIKTEIAADYYSRADMDAQIGTVRHEIETSFNSWNSTITAETSALADKVQKISNTLEHRSDGVWLSASGTSSSNTSLWLQNSSISFVIEGDTANPPLILTPNSGIFQRIIVREAMELGPATASLIALFNSDGSGYVG